MSVFFIGAMPWVQLFLDGRRTAWVSVVHADWSERGSGRLLTLRQDGHLRILGTNEALAGWLVDWLIRPTDEAPASTSFEPADVELDMNAGHGLLAAAGGIGVELTRPLDRRLVRRDDYPLGDRRPTCSWVRISCAHASVTIDGEPVPGAPVASTDAYGPVTTAQINLAEVWTT